MKRSQKQKQLEQVQKQKYRQYAIIGLALFGGLLLLVGIMMMRPGAGDRADAGVEFGDLSAQQVMAVGKERYDTYCAACHGFDLEGQPNWQQPFADGSFKAPPHDETGHTWHHSDAYLVESIKLGGARLPANIGVSNMPAYAEVLTDEEIWAILAYIKSDWPQEILEIQSGQ